MLNYITAGLLVICSCIHLYHSWNDDYEKRRYTKPFLLPLIIAYYITTCHIKSVDISPVLIIALVSSWLGDVLLIPKGNKWFTAGGISFMVTHFMFIVVYIQQVNFSRVNWLIVIPAVIVYYGISALVIKALKDSTPKKMLAPMYFYLLCNSTMNVFALMQFISCRNAGSTVAIIGAVLFFASDCTLYLCRYHKNKNLIFRKHFTVMLTYILGEFLITQGLIMLGK